MIRNPFFQNRLHFLFWVWSLLTGPAAFAQKQQLRFEHLSTNNGLSQSNAICLLQDSRGFMWFGTQDGLNRYDGYTFVIYKNNPQDPASISNSYIKDLLEDSKGNIWVATLGGGLNKFDRDQDRFIHYRQDKKNRNSLSDDFVNCIAEDSRGDLWVGTETGGLDRIDGKTGRFTRYAYDKNDPNSISDNDVTAILEDSRHRIWVGTFHGGMNLLDPGSGRFTRFQHNDRDSSSLSYNTVLRFFEDHQHRLWIGTRGGGLDLLNFPDNRFHHFKNDPHNSNSLPRDVILTLTGDDNNNIWIGTENGGLSIFNPEKGTFANYEHDDLDNTSLGNNSIYSLYKDPYDNMWIGTYSGGVDLYNRAANQFTLYKHNSTPNSPGNNNILDFHEDIRGNVWIGTDGGGVELFDPRTKKFTHFRHSPGHSTGICGNYIICIREDRENNIWMGSCGDGTSIYDPVKKTFRQIRKDPQNKASISGNNNGAITLDKDKEIWISSWGDGLNRYQPETGNFIHYRHDNSDTNSISGDRIITLFTDSKGYIWIGTFDKGLDLFDKTTKTFTHFVHDSSRNCLSDNSIHCIYEDRQGNVWIATKSGLNCLDRHSGHFTHYFPQDGLPDALIAGILEDDKGYLWISTNNGLSRFNPQTRTFKNFSIADGLQSNEFKAHSCLKTASGAMYFGGTNGFNEFFPDSIKDNSYKYPLVITSFQIFNKEVPVSGDKTKGSPLQKDITETKEITISYKQSVISFAFASLHYTIPEKKQYAYKLEGFDKKWNNAGTSHTATYTNLDPGKYIFEVKGLNEDGTWSSDITSLHLIITPPFWQTWWFRLLAVTSLATCIVSIHRIRMRVIQGQKKKLEQQVAVLLDKAVAQGKFEIASDVMHDIGNAVVGFGSYLTRIRRLMGEGDRDDLKNLAGFFETQQPAMTAAIGEAKAGAVVTLLNSIGQTQKDTREEIRQSITEQLNIITRIQEILNIHRQYITGQESQERKPVNLRSIINDCMSMLFASVNKTAIAISLDFPDELPPIKGDRTRLMQLMLDILKNSIEAIDINAAIKTISIRMQRQEDLLVLQVRDSGTGFNETTAGRLFEKGFTTKDTGAGLGLYSCRTIVESHEGSITVTSEGPGKGALATIRFKI